MITQVNLKHFKCFELLKLPLTNLTLLSGANASGKSSILQAMVLLHQTMREHEWSTRLMLNGNTLKLGTVADVVDKVHGRHAFEIGLREGSDAYSWEFSGDRSDMSLTIDSIDISGSVTTNPKKLQFMFPDDSNNTAVNLANRIRGLTYITAERIGPREFYPLEDRQNASVVGPAGEYAISILHSGRDEKVLKGLEIDDVPATRLRQVEARMQTFFPGCGLAVEKVPRMNAVTLGLRTSEDTDFHRPVNVGFGLTQVLPIVVAALSANSHDILLIENPEVHLHPAGQALMGQFLADVASAGVQVIIETHSDHILNGIRRAVRSKILKPDQATLHFFRPRKDNQSQVISPQLDETGNVDIWPEGFFDQYDKDMNHFAGWDE
ncbi:AAA family ATPase [Thiolapillus sp.]|uniref:AAA family ATPase n=1 Tax=Thiolapillus sp. TaxID=2017437 RepID=UPI003AF411DC